MSNVSFIYRYIFTLKSDKDKLLLISVFNVFKFSPLNPDREIAKKRGGREGFHPEPPLEIGSFLVDARGYLVTGARSGISAIFAVASSSLPL